MDSSSVEITINLHNRDYSLQLKISIMDEKIFDEWFNELINEHKHNKMKQFSLKEYLKNPNQRVVIIDGEEVRIICTDRKLNIFR